MIILYIFAQYPLPQFVFKISSGIKNEKVNSILWKNNIKRGFYPRGFYPEGLSSGGDFVRRGFCPRGFCPRGFYPRPANIITTITTAGNSVEGSIISNYQEGEKCPEFRDRTWVFFLMWIWSICWTKPGQYPAGIVCLCFVGTFMRFYILADTKGRIIY